MFCVETNLHRDGPEKLNLKLPYFYINIVFNRIRYTFLVHKSSSCFIGCFCLCEMNTCVPILVITHRLQFICSEETAL